MAFTFYSTAGGLVDETCWGDGTGATYFIGGWFYNLGKAPYPANYSFLCSLNNPSGNNGSCEGLMLVADSNGPIIRMSSSGIDGTTEWDTDYHTSNLTATQLQKVHVCAALSKSKRQLYIRPVAKVAIYFRAGARGLRRHSGSLVQVRPA